MVVVVVVECWPRGQCWAYQAEEEEEGIDCGSSGWTRLKEEEEEGPAELYTSTIISSSSPTTTTMISYNSSPLIPPC